MGEMLELVRDTMAAVLRIPPEEIEVDVGFIDAGMDSAMMTAFARRLEQVLGGTLSATLLFDHPTAQDVAAHLSGAGQPGAAHASNGHGW